MITGETSAIPTTNPRMSMSNQTTGSERSAPIDGSTMETIEIGTMKTRNANINGAIMMLAGIRASGTTPKRDSTSGSVAKQATRPASIAGVRSVERRRIGEIE